MQVLQRPGILLMLLGLFTTELTAQRLVRLGQPQARSADGFTDVIGVEELRDGSVVAVDRRERRIARIDFARNTVSPISRQGEGPREYTATYGVVRWSGDTLLVYGQRDFLKLDPQGEPAGKFAVPSEVIRQRGFAAPKFVDARGRLYFDVSERPARDAAGNFKPILRKTVVWFDPRSGMYDTLPVTMQTRDPNGPFVSFWRPYAAEDAFALLSGGDIALFRARDYRMEILSPVGVRTVAVQLPYAPLRVSEAERDAFRDEQLSRPTASATVVGAPPSTTSGADRVAARRSVGVPDEAFPEFLPPFGGARPVLVDASGNMWVQRSARASDTDRVYDVVHRDGRVLQRVTIPDRGRVVGFGTGVVYIVRLDDVDMEWVERHAIR